MKKKQFPTISEMNDIYSKYVLRKKNKDTKKLEDAAMQWMKAATKNKMTYETNWLGVPIIQFPEDLILMQELIFRTKPDIIIETGIAHGGSLIYYASLCELLGKGEVIGIDIEIRLHNKKLLDKHPLRERIHVIEGDSTSLEVFNRCKSMFGKKKNILVILDSNHEKKHVLRELELYSSFVTKGNYIVVFDTTDYYLAKSGYPKKLQFRFDWMKESPKQATDEFLLMHKDFSIDPYFHKFYISSAIDGFLVRR